MNPIISYLSLVTLSFLLIVHGVAAWYYLRKIYAGRNGATFAIFAHLLGIGQLLTVEVGTVIILTWVNVTPEQMELGQTGTLISRIILLITALYLVAILTAEAARPIKKETTTNRKIFNKLK